MDGSVPSDASDLAKRKREIEAKLRALQSDEVTSAVVNGVELHVGDRVAVRSEPGVLETAETVWASLPARTAIQYRLDEIYKGESGRVMRILTNYSGKDGLVAVELRFADDALRTFVASALEIGEYPPMPNASKGTVGKVRVVKDSADTKGDGSGRNGAVEDGRISESTQDAQRGGTPSQPVAPPVAWPKQKPGRVPPALMFKYSAEQRSQPATPEVGTPASNATPRGDSASASPLDLARSDSAFLKRIGQDLAWKPEEAVVAASPVEGIAPSSDAEVASAATKLSAVTHNGKMSSSHIDPAALLKGSLHLESLLVASKIPPVPLGYKAKFNVEDRKGSRIPRLTSKGTAAVSPASATSTPSKSSAAIAASLAMRGIAPSLARRLSNSDDGGDLPVSEPLRVKAAPLLRYCSLTTINECHGDEEVRKIVIRESHASIAAVRSMCTRELGWGGKGLRVERLFNGETGAEISDVNEIADGMTLVATSGEDFRPPAKRAVAAPLHSSARAGTPPRRPAVGASAVASPNPSRGSTASGGGAAKPSAATTAHPPRSTTPSLRGSTAAPLAAAARGKVGTANGHPPAVSKGSAVTPPPPPRRDVSPKRSVITLRVYVNGDYGDAKHSQVPDSRQTVTIHPTHKSLGSVLTTIARALQWHTMGRKVEVLYDASGAEIKSIADLRDGASIVASSGDRYIIPMPSSMLYRDMLAQLQQGHQGDATVAASSVGESANTGTSSAKQHLGVVPGAPPARSAASKTPTPAAARRSVAAATNPPTAFRHTGPSQAAPSAQHAATSHSASSRSATATGGGGGAAATRAQTLMNEIRELERQLGQ